MFSRYSLATSRAFSSAGVGAGKNVGFIGLGCMGSHMTVNLKNAGFNVKGYDLSPEARQASDNAGVPTVDSVADVCKDVEYVVTCLPETRHVEETLKMDGGIFASSAPNTLICDVSTIHPDGARKFHAEAK